MIQKVAFGFNKTEDICTEQKKLTGEDVHVKEGGAAEH